VVAAARTATICNLPCCWLSALVPLSLLAVVVVKGFLHGALLQQHRDELDAYIADVVGLPNCACHRARTAIPHRAAAASSASDAGRAVVKEISCL
jgi:hypothetical protein